MTQFCPAPTPSVKFHTFFFSSENFPKLSNTIYLHKCFIQCTDTITQRSIRLQSESKNCTSFKSMILIFSCTGSSNSFQFQIIYKFGINFTKFFCLFTNRSVLKFSFVNCFIILTALYTFITGISVRQRSQSPSMV